MKQGYLYRHIRLDNNEVFYVGIGGFSKYEKEYTYKRAYDNRRNKWWKSIIDNTNYEVDILLENLTWEEACIKEIEFIKIYGRRDLGLGTLVNLTNGGDGMLGYVTSQETKEKISKSKKGVKNEKLSKICKGLKKRLGVKLSNETKEKISRSLLNTRVGKDNHESRKIIDTNTGIVYYGKREAAEGYGIPLSTLKAYLSGRLKNKTTLEYDTH